MRYQFGMKKIMITIIEIITCGKLYTLFATMRWYRSLFFDRKAMTFHAQLVYDGAFNWTIRNCNIHGTHSPMIRVSGQTGGADSDEAGCDKTKK